MATAYPSKRKRFSDVSSVATRVKKIGSDMPLPWDKIAPPDVAEWLNVYAQANNTSRELLLASQHSTYRGMFNRPNNHKGGLQATS